MRILVGQVFVRDAVHLYKVDNGRYPMETRWLRVLELRNTGDPWGGEHNYRGIGGKDGTPVISSHGPDWQKGTEDDILASVGR